jgi:RHS repeat-associated protein
MSLIGFRHGTALLASCLAVCGLYLQEAHAAVGRTDSTYGVTQDGSAAYTIPIRATEGINGFTPRLAISYSGPGARTILGVGFALSGFSYITPCRKTIAQDLDAAPVTLTSGDRYCLDGARLRLVSGTYGSTNATYRTELDQLVRVTSLASSGGIPGSFKVEMPNGLEYEYGNSTDSRLMSGTGSGATPQFWALNEISDLTGNSVKFVYDTDAATRRFRPLYISYTERGGTGDYRISFYYQPASPLKMQRYTPSILGGAAHEENRVLDRIELQESGTKYRAYKLQYESGAGDNKRLSSVQECAYTPSEDCFEETEFTWQSATPGHDALSSTSKAVTASVLPLDVNGDGIQDLAWASSGTWRYMLGGASGFGSINNSTVTATNPSKAIVLEWNGDGFDDLLIDWTDGKWRVLKGSASGFATTAVAAGTGGIPSGPSSTSWTVSDVDADGRDDLLSMPLNAALLISVRYNGASGFGAATTMYSNPGFHLQSKGFIQATGASSVRRPDFNGDSRFDLLIYACFWDDELDDCLATYRWYQLMSEGTGFTWEGAIPGASYNIDVRFGDFNADGLTDIVYPQATIWTLGLGQGGGGFDIVSGPSNAGQATYQTLVGDYDQDGYDDLYVTKNSPFQWQIFRSTGAALASTPISTSISGSGLAWMLQDQNGDSLPDVGRYDSSTLVWSLGAHMGDPGERLLVATDGLENIVSFGYLPMTSNTVYAKGTGATYPNVDFEGSAPLVRTMHVNPAGGASYTFTYKYQGARLHAQGRSFLGMAKRETTDGRNDVFQTETYRQDFPYIGAPEAVTTKQSSIGTAKTIQTIAHSYNRHVLDSGAGNERYLPYRWKTITTGYEVEGVRNGDPVTEVTETHSVNTWGNSTFVSIDAKDIDGNSPETGQIYRTEVTSTYIQDTSNWCIPLPMTRSEKRILPDGTNETRDISWDVDGAYCRFDSETLQPGDGSLLALVTVLGHDACGNVDSVTLKPEGVSTQNRVTSIDYGARCQRPEIITNAENHVWEYAYDWPTAQPVALTDPNELVTTFERDGFGRLTRELRPDDTGVRFALSACTAGNSWCGKNSAARVRVTRTERSNTDALLRTDEVFLDGIGRTRWSHSDSLESGPAIVETVFDAFDRPTARTQPYFSGGAVYPTSYIFDLVGRLSSIDAPVSESTPSGRTTLFRREGRKLEVTDPENQVTTHFRNVIGQEISLSDPNPGGVTAYAYHPFGELKSIKDAANNLTTWSINPRGFVTANSDPDSGVFEFQVNAFGETTKIRDAKTPAPSWTTEFTFDKLSRMKTRVEAEGTTTLTWGTAAHNSSSNKYIGRLKSVSSPGGYAESYLFDELSRLQRLRTTIDATNYDFNYVYADVTGLLLTVQYPLSTGASRLRLQYQYSNNLLRRVKEYGGTLTYWEGNSTDGWGHYQDELFGSGVVEYSDFDQASGLMATREAGVGGGIGLIDSSVDWADLRGNVTARHDPKLATPASEVFQNDNLGRFDDSTLNGSPNLDVALDAIGNITAKGGVTYSYVNQPGCPSYAHTQPRAVRKIGSTVYCYDANGNMSKRGGSTISYTSYNLPSVINAGSNSSTLSYGAFRNRYKQVAASGAGTETTLYVAGLFERVTRPGGDVEYRHYIPGGNGIAGIHTRRTSGTNSTYYWHADHLGSPELITDSAGGNPLRLSFGAYGERRDGSDWSGPPSAADLTAIGNITRRGFTGHEHLDSVGLIHMNGRVYDPAAGRFLSVDPIVHVGLSQSPNGYSYVFNMPLSLIDPSGFDPAKEDVTVKNCVGECFQGKADLFETFEARGWFEFTPRVDVYDPPAGACIDGTVTCTFVTKAGDWDGKSSGGPTIIYGAILPSKSFVEIAGAFLFPNVAALGERGVKGSWADDGIGFLKATWNAADAVHRLMNPGAALLPSNEIQIADDELLGAAAFDVGTALSGLAGYSRAAITRGMTTSVVRTSRSGEKAIRITRPDGSVIDISPQRVKEYVPNTHPNAPPGTLQRVQFPDAQPGSKGLKRDPTPEELELLRNLP